MTDRVLRSAVPNVDVIIDEYNENIVEVMSSAGSSRLATDVGQRRSELSQALIDQAALPATTTMAARQEAHSTEALSLLSSATGADDGPTSLPLVHGSDQSATTVIVAEAAETGRIRQTKLFNGAERHLSSPARSRLRSSTYFLSLQDRSPKAKSRPTPTEFPGLDITVNPRSVSRVT